MQTSKKWIDLYLSLEPEIKDIESAARGAIKKSKKEVYPYQAAALYHLAKPYNGSRALEVGTANGYSCFYLAMAMPNSPLATLNTSKAELNALQKQGGLSRFPNVTAKHMSSWNHLKQDRGPYGFIFIDGDHKQVKRDLPFFNQLEVGGTIVFHDYSPKGSKRACPPVFEAVNWLAESLGRKPDILIVDENGVGMAGFIRQAGEKIQQQSKGDDRKMYRYNRKTPLDTGVAFGDIVMEGDLKNRTIAAFLKSGTLLPVSTPPLTALPGFDKRAVELSEAGIETIEDLLKANPIALSNKTKASATTIRQWQTEAQKWLKPKSG